MAKAVDVVSGQLEAEVPDRRFGKNNKAAWNIVKFHKTIFWVLIFNSSDRRL